MKNLSKKTLEDINGGFPDYSWRAFLEEITGEDINGNGQIGIGCIFGC